MQQTPIFTTLELKNRLGQPVELGVTHIITSARDYIFVTAPSQQASSLIRKNAEHFAFQLCERFKLEPRRFEMVEFRQQESQSPLWRWRFEWVGHSPLSGRCDAISSSSQEAMLLGLLNSDDSVRVAAAR